MKILQAKLKRPVEAAVNLGGLDFTHDWLHASSVLEVHKKNLLHTIKRKMHEKVAVLSLDDIDFKITSN